MAIYHLNVKIIQRSKGCSATAAAAYRAAEKIHDDKTNVTHDYRKKRGVFGAEILAPSHAPDWVNNRDKLWNEVEKIEKRCDARVAREIDIALPVELNREQKKELVRDFVKEQFISQGMVADISFHNFDSTACRRQGGISKNPHAHIMLTTRHINDDGFGFKQRDWDKKELLQQWRSDWAQKVNLYLEQAGHKEIKVDHRTLEEQGINRLPQIHLGADVAHMKKRGIRTNRGDEYDRIADANLRIKQLEQEINNMNNLVARIEREKRHRLEVATKENKELAQNLVKFWWFKGQPKSHLGTNYDLQYSADHKLTLSRKSGELIAELQLPLNQNKPQFWNLNEEDKERLSKLKMLLLPTQEEAKKFRSALIKAWNFQNRPSFYEGYHYNLRYEDAKLTLTRKSGESVVEIPFDRNKPTSWNLKEKDKERLNQLGQEMDERIKQLEQQEQKKQQRSSQKGWGLSR